MTIVRNLGDLANQVDSSGTLNIGGGGTNATTANGGFNALAPNQTGNSGKYLTTNGTDTSWNTIPSTTPAGSTGQVQYNNAGSFGAISSGTSGQVLTSQGSGSAPTWATASGGSWIYLSTVTASNSATVDIETTFNSTYDTYYIVASKIVPQTSGESLYCRLKVNGDYDTASYRFHAILNDDTESAYNYIRASNASWIRIMPALGNSTGQNGEFVARVTQPALTTNTKMITHQGSYIDGSNRVGWILGAGDYSASQAALTGVRFVMSSGNITSGVFRLYGVKNS